MATPAEDKKLIDRLLSVNPAIKDSWQRSEIVNDVLADNVLTRQKTESTMPGMMASISKWFKSTFKVGSYADGYASGDCPELMYLPKGKLETAQEYGQRISMTPWLPLTPGILAGRLGAMFNTPPELEGSDAGGEDGEGENAYADFEKSCTADGKSLQQVIYEEARIIQKDGWFGVLVDRTPVPAGVNPANLSQADANTLKLNKQRLVLYSARQILDMEDDAQGLKSVKVAEGRIERASLLADTKRITTVRLIDRLEVNSYEITEDGDNKTVTGPVVFRHGFKDASGRPQIPFVMAHAFSGADGIGRPSLIGSARADVSATRILSDITWCVFVVGQPILTFKTDRDETDLPKWGLGATRFIPLKLGNVDLDGEALEYCQLDSAGLDKQIEMYDRFQAQAKEQAGEDAPGAVTQPLQEKSGISRAWEFKTGEERVLFLITRELQTCMNKVMDIVAVDMGRDPENIAIKFNDSFEQAEPEKEAELVGKLVPMLERRSWRAVAEILKRAIKQAFPGLPKMDEIEKQLDEEPELPDPMELLKASGETDDSAEKPKNLKEKSKEAA